MIISGMPGNSGFGFFVPGRGYSFPVPVFSGQPDSVLTKVPVVRCTLSPRVPIGLITKLKNPKAREG